jgi:hypothetical protein
MTAFASPSSPAPRCWPPRRRHTSTIPFLLIKFPAIAVGMLNAGILN